MSDSDSFTDVATTTETDEVARDVSSEASTDSKSNLHESVHQQQTVPKDLVLPAQNLQDEKRPRHSTISFVEFCAGSAALSAEVRKAGFRVIPIDHERNRLKPLATVVSLDLASDSLRDLVLKMLNNLRPFAAHFGLPCGTCSRARDKARPKHLQGQFDAPPPLRSARWACHT